MRAHGWLARMSVRVAINMHYLPFVLKCMILINKNFVWRRFFVCFFFCGRRCDGDAVKLILSSEMDEHAVNRKGYIYASCCLEPINYTHCRPDGQIQVRKLFRTNEWWWDDLNSMGQWRSAEYVIFSNYFFAFFALRRHICAIWLSYLEPNRCVPAPCGSECTKSISH